MKVQKLGWDGGCILNVWEHSFSHGSLFFPIVRLHTQPSKRQHINFVSDLAAHECCLLPTLEPGETWQAHMHGFGPFSFYFLYLMFSVLFILCLTVSVLNWAKYPVWANTLYFNNNINSCYYKVFINWALTIWQEFMCTMSLPNLYHCAGFFPAPRMLWLSSWAFLTLIYPSGLCCLTVSHEVFQNASWHCELLIPSLHQL